MLKISGVNKSFGDKKVLRNVNAVFEDGKIYCLMGASGMGKTTLLRIILGLESMDSGEISGMQRSELSAMFQENRLCETLTPIENVALVCPKNADRGEIQKSLEEILPHECMKQPACELSGGMKRRVSLARAVIYPSKAVIFDEPFTGLDIETRKEVISYLLKHQNGRTYIIATHGENDAQMLGAEKIELSQISEIYGGEN